MLAWPAPEPVVAPLPPEPGVVTAFDTRQQKIIPVGPAPSADRPATIYVCGITPYDSTHLGHANTYVAFDVLHRAWRDCGRAVSYVQNVTDVDDPLLARAAATQVKWEDLAQSQIELFHSDMVALRVLPPAHYVAATETMELVSQLITRLNQRPKTIYAAASAPPDLYFRSRSDPKFGSLSHLDFTEMLPIFAERGGDPERVGKHDPLDCLVWQLERPADPSWDSAHGRGRPGWHIECAAIAMQYLGESIDVLGGGRDLIFPHHEMSASQVRLATGQEPVGAYLHSGLVGLGGEKMSKSKGNLVFVSRLLQSGVDPMAIRLALLSQHYREDWSWTEQILAAAQTRLARWRAAVRRPQTPPSNETIAQVRRAVRSDLDTPTALKHLDEWAAAQTGLESARAGAEISAVCEGILGVAL